MDYLSRHPTGLPVKFDPYEEFVINRISELYDDIFDLIESDFILDQIIQQAHPPKRKRPIVSMIREVGSTRKAGPAAVRKRPTVNFSRALRNPTANEIAGS